MHECFPKHSRMGTARMKLDKETDEDSNKTGVSIGKKWKVVMKKKKSRGPITTKSKYNNNKHNLLVFYKILKNFNESQLINNKMDLNNPKIKNHPPFPTRNKDPMFKIIILF